MSHGLFIVPRAVEDPPHVQVYPSVIRIKRQSPADSLLRSRWIPITKVEDQAHHGMRFSQRSIEFQRLTRRRLCHQYRLTWPVSNLCAGVEVIVSQPDIYQSIVRAKIDGLPKGLDTLLDFRRIQRVQKMVALQIQLIRLNFVGVLQSWRSWLRMQFPIRIRKRGQLILNRRLNDI